MQKRILTFLSGAALLLTMGPRLQAASGPSGEEKNKVITYVNSKGSVVFTNMVDNTPAPVAPVIQERADPLADQMPPVLKSLVDTISANHGVDPALVRAVMKTESNFDRWAVSHKGARGLMQLIPETGRRFGVSDFHDPQQNIEGGVRYLRFLLDKFSGNIDLSLAAYNAGENLVARLGRIPAIPETTNYVRKIRAIYKKPSAGVLPPSPVVAKLEAPKEDAPQLYKFVDSRGVTHYSNIGPPNN